MLFLTPKAIVYFPPFDSVLALTNDVEVQCASTKLSLYDNWQLLLFLLGRQPPYKKFDQMETMMLRGSPY